MLRQFVLMTGGTRVALCLIIVFITPTAISLENVLENVALNKSCNVSSVYYWNTLDNEYDTYNNPCNAANNGNSSTLYGKGNCINTHWDDRTPYWTVNLGRIYTIARIDVYPMDGNISRLQSIIVGIDGREDIPLTFVDNGSHLSLILSPPRLGQVVTITRQDYPRSDPRWQKYNYLRFCEVQVLAVMNYENVALNKPCNMSSIYYWTGTDGYNTWNNTCDMANNGNTSTVYAKGNCINTCWNDRTPTWTVNLGHVYTIARIDVYPMAGEESRMTNVMVRIDDGEQESLPYMNNKSPLSLKLSPPRLGQVVTVTRLDRANDVYQYMRFCEVQVLATECADGYYGFDCAPCGHCAGGATCDKVNGHCPGSACLPGWMPPTCTQNCTDGQFGDNCSQTCDQGCQSGTCDVTNGACTCRPGWGSNNACTDCEAGHFNKTGDCPACGQCLDGPATCDVTTGRCPGGCLPGFRPPLCQQVCNQGFYGVNCTHRCGVGCSTPCTSGSHDNCYICDNKNGACQCRTGWANGTSGSCTVCADHYYGTDCQSQCGHCSNNAVCDKVNGSCPVSAGQSAVCDGPYFPPLCQTGCHNESYGDDCKSLCGHCSDNGTDDGVCDRYNGTCVLCQPGYYPPLCQHACDDSSYGLNCVISCGRCADRGVCNKTNGHCSKCLPGYYLPLCQKECDGHYHGQDCKQRCGHCANNVTCHNVNGSCPVTGGLTAVCDGRYLPPLCTSELSQKESSSPVGGIAGGVVGAVVAAVVAAAVVFFIRRRRQSSGKGGNANDAKDKLPAFSDVSASSGKRTTSPVAKPKAAIKPSQRVETDHEDHLYGNVPDSKQRYAESASHDSNMGDNPIPPAAAAQVIDNSKNGQKASSEDVPVEQELYEHGYLYARYTSLPAAALDSFQKLLLDRLAESQSLDEEFEKFPKGMPHPHDIGLRPLNNRKNRFKQLCAYDANRVVLQRPEGDNGTDYINASWIRGAEYDHSYIAAQGPRANSVSDLWWMVWQENVTQIVMLTNLMEDGKEKCEQYWPAEGKTQTYGQVTVTSADVDERADFVVRCFTVKCTQNGVRKQREVHQYHYTVWPDHGVPAAGSLVSFWHYVTARQQSTSPPVVHCSAGVGRTGTYLALDIAMNRTSQDRDVNVYDIVMELREQRSLMVQTSVQYKFLHEVVLEAYTARHSWMNVEEMDVRFPTTIDLHKPKSILDKEFKMLTEMRAWAKPNTTAGRQEENSRKNRDPNILPDDALMAYLSVYVRGRNQYINAVYMSSFRVRRGLLLTQLPLPDTVVDLWRLVEGCEVSTILSLGSKMEAKTVENYCSYWPQKIQEPLKIGPYTVTLSSSTRLNDNLISYQMTLGKDEMRQEVRVLHYTDWQGDLPGTIPDVIQLVDMVKAAQEKDASSPVIIQCLDGATRSGLFCVLYDVIMRVINDNEVNVFSNVRHVHHVRPHAVPSEVQYRYCYKVAQEVKRNHGVYANLTDR